MSFNHGQLKKNGNNIGKTIKHLKQVKMLQNRNFTRLICSHIHQVQDFTLGIRLAISQRIF